MGTVGINFGSATSGQGFDVASTVTAIQSAQKSIENPWNAQLTALTAQDTALSTIGTDLATLSTALQKLTDFTGVTAQKNGSSSDPGTLALTGATSAAVAGSYTVVVSKLAQTGTAYSDYVAAGDTLGGNFQIQVGGNGTIKTVTTSAGETVASLAAKINAGNYGVTASVNADTVGSRLTIVSATPGGAGALSFISNLTDVSQGNQAVALNSGQTAQDAEFSVNNTPLRSSTNTLTQAIKGVTFQLLATSATAVQVQITNDTASVAAALGTLVTSYNAVAKDLKTQEGKDSSGSAQPLYGSPTLALIQSQLSAAIYKGTASGSIGSITQLGIDFKNDGTLALNTDTLTTALTNNFTDIVGFLQSTSGFGHELTSALNGLSTTATYGAIHVAQQQNASQEAALKKSIASEEALLATQKISLTAELNTANQILQAIPSQLNQIDQIYSAVTGFVATKR